MENIKICDCGHPPSNHESFTTGYGRDENGKTMCYECCAEKDKEIMRTTGKIDLYLTGNKYVGNWPSSLKIPINRIKKGKHNIAGNCYHVWFNFEGHYWHGIQYGDNTQVCHCKQVKD